MNIHQTISLKTKIGAIGVGYNNFPISQNEIPTGEHRNTCTAMMLNDWIKTNYNLMVETKFDDSQMWGYILWRIDKKDDKSPEVKLTHIDNDSMFKTEEIAFDEGLQRAIKEIKYNSK
jgi:hypothetical protein